jgi:hypothetical protein
MLLQRTGLDIWPYRDTRFLIVDYETFFCADIDSKTFKRLEFSKF